MRTKWNKINKSFALQIYAWLKNIQRVCQCPFIHESNAQQKPVFLIIRTKRRWRSTTEQLCSTVGFLAVTLGNNLPSPPLRCARMSIDLSLVLAPSLHYSVRPGATRPAMPRCHALIDVCDTCFWEPPSSDFVAIFETTNAKATHGRGWVEKLSTINVTLRG